jgi:hypothetical protein
MQKQNIAAADGHNVIVKDSLVDCRGMLLQQANSIGIQTVPAGDSGTGLSCLPGRKTSGLLGIGSQGLASEYKQLNTRLPPSSTESGVVSGSLVHQRSGSGEGTVDLKARGLAKDRLQDCGRLVGFE